MLFNPFGYSKKSIFQNSYVAFVQMTNNDRKTLGKTLAF